MGVYKLGSARRKFGNQRKIHQAIREKVGQKNTRDRVGGRKRAIRELVIGEEKRSGGERCGASDLGERDWGESYR